MEKTLYYLHSLSALHVGIGSGSGVIDLPIARERATLLPQVPGSSVKGVLRGEYRGEAGAGLALFGPESGENASEYAGALAVGDGRLLALPVRSWYGTFAWVTCPLILRRYQRDLRDIGAQGFPKEIPSIDENHGYCCSASKLERQNKIYLEDLDLDAEISTTADDWAEFIAQEMDQRTFHETQLFKAHFLIVSDELLDFLAETATEIRTRVRINPDTHTVVNGALWTEEYLPAETLFWGLLACDRARNDAKKDGKELLDLLQNQTLQIGGNATTGSGQTRWIKRGGGV